MLYALVKYLPGKHEHCTPHIFKLIVTYGSKTWQKGDRDTQRGLKPNIKITYIKDN